MSSTLTNFFSGKRRKPESTSSNSDNCASPDFVSKSDSKKLRHNSESEKEEEDNMAFSDVLEEINKKLANMATADSVKTMKDDIEKVLSKINNRMDKIETALFDLSKENDDLKKTMTQLREDNKNLQQKLAQEEKESKRLRMTLNDQEQHGRGWNVRVYGVKEVQGGKGSEAVADCVKKCVDIFSNKIGVSVSEKDIEIAHRTGKQNRDRPRPIIVRFFSRQVRSNVLSSRRKLKQTGISVGEDLTQANYRLMNIAKQHSASLTTWSSNGKILAKLKTGEIVKVDLDTNVDAAFRKALAGGNTSGR